MYWSLRMSDNQSENSHRWGNQEAPTVPPGKVNGSKAPRNKLTAAQRFSLMKWAEKNKETIKIRGTKVAATEVTHELGFHVNDVNVKSICEAVGIELIHGFHGEVGKKKNRILASA